MSPFGANELASSCAPVAEFDDGVSFEFFSYLVIILS